MHARLRIKGRCRWPSTSTAADVQRRLWCAGVSCLPHLLIPAAVDANPRLMRDMLVAQVGGLWGAAGGVSVRLGAPPALREGVSVVCLVVVSGGGAVCEEERDSQRKDDALHPRGCEEARRRLLCGGGMAH